MRKIVILDDEGLGSEELGFEALCELGQVARYRNTIEPEIAARIGNSEIVLTNKAKIDAAVMDACPLLKYIGVLSTRYNVVDVPEATKRNIVVTNIPAYSTHAVVQHSLALLLEVCNHVHLHNRLVKEGKWENSPIYCFWERPLTELLEKTMGIVGLGRIGQGLAKVAQGLGMNVLAYTRTKRDLPGVQEVSLQELLERSDVLALCCPLTEETEGMIGRNELEKMKMGAILLNTASGKIVREADVLSALENGQLGYYLADVMEKEPPCKNDALAHHPRSVFTPHLAWAPLETRRRLVETAVANVRAYLEGRVQNGVNMPPDCSKMPKNDK